MKRIHITRRQVLRGTGGFTLGLPFLPSLVPGPAYGATVTSARKPCFVATITKHGGISAANMCPPASTIDKTQTLYPGHDIRSGTLKPTSEGSDTKLSPVLRAPSDKLTNRLVGKLNVLQGFDFPFYMGHHVGGHLGNFVRNDQGPKNIPHVPTIDQVMAWSRSFYGDLQGVKLRAIVAGSEGFGAEPSWGYSNPEAKTGTVERVKAETSSAALFDKVLGGVMPSAPMEPQRRPIIDRILANYRSLRESNRRLSAEDRQRLDDHIGRLVELERVAKTGGTGRACVDVKKPADSGGGQFDNSPGGASRYFSLLNDVIVMAFACGTSRIAVLPNNQKFSDHGGNWHQDVAHNWQAPDKQQVLASAVRAFFSGAFVDLARKLDAVESAPGVTLLDDTLMQWTQESGPETHSAQEMVIVTAGSAAGFLKTGLYVDYRSQNPNAHLSVFGPKDPWFLGLQHRQWLATVLQAMGLPPSEWQRDGKPGYGADYMHPTYVKAVHASVYEKASEVVPLLKA